MSAPIQITAADGRQIPAFVALPEATAHGAIVVLPEIFGVNRHIRAVAQGFAAQGFAALALDTFERVRSGVELGYEQSDIRTGVALKGAVEKLPAPGVMQDIDAAIAHANTWGKVGVVGYCWGGLLAWRAASMADGLAAAVCYYGGGMTKPEERAHAPKVPVLAHFSDHDDSTPTSGIEALQRDHPQVETHLYHAPHGFNCDHRPAFDASAAQLAGERTQAFFERYLR